MSEISDNQTTNTTECDLWGQVCDGMTNVCNRKQSQPFLHSKAFATIWIVPGSLHNNMQEIYILSYWSLPYPRLASLVVHLRMMIFEGVKPKPYSNSSLWIYINTYIYIYIIVLPLEYTILQSYFLTCTGPMRAVKKPWSPCIKI